MVPPQKRAKTLLLRHELAKVERRICQPKALNYWAKYNLSRYFRKIRLPFGKHLFESEPGPLVLADPGTSPLWHWKLNTLDKITEHQYQCDSYHFKVEWISHKQEAQTPTIQRWKKMGSI